MLTVHLCDGGQLGAVVPSGVLHAVLGARPRSAAAVDDRALALVNHGPEYATDVRVWLRQDPLGAPVKIAWSRAGLKPASGALTVPDEPNGLDWQAPSGYLDGFSVFEIPVGMAHALWFRREGGASQSLMPQSTSLIIESINGFDV